MAIRSGSRSVFDVPALTRAVIGVALLAISGSTARAEPPASRLQSGGSSYGEVCAECHGATLGGGKGPPLRGAAFLQNWRHKTGQDLYNRILTTMPASAPGTLDEATVLDITIYILHQSGVDVGSHAATSDLLSTIEIK